MRSKCDFIVSAIILYHILYYWFELRLISTSVCSRSCWSSSSAFQERKRGMENVCGRRFSIFLGTFRLISLRHIERRTWTHSFSPSSRSFTPPLFSPSPFTHVSRVDLHRSVSLSLYLLPASLQPKPVSVNPGPVCLCLRVSLVRVTCFLLNSDHKSLTSSQPLSKAPWY